MRKIVSVLYICGIISICSFFTPIFTTLRYGQPRRIIFSHIFSTQGDIIILRLLLYFALWTGICLALLFQFKDFKFKKKIKINNNIQKFFKNLDFKYNLTGNKEYLKYKAKWRQDRLAYNQARIANFKRVLKEQEKVALAELAAEKEKRDKLDAFIDITPELKASVEGGLPLFAIKQADHLEEIKSAIRETQKEYADNNKELTLATIKKFAKQNPDLSEADVEAAYNEVQKERTNLVREKLTLPDGTV